jgi:DnaJ-class molecular chaperone
MLRLFLTGVAVAAVTMSCTPRMEERAPRYDQTECPFCLHHKGVCRYCGGTKKCPFCWGSGIRTAVTVKIPDENIEGGASYSEKCPYCNGTGTCRYCNGSGVCWACNGDGKIHDWNYFTPQAAHSAKEEAPAASELSAGPGAEQQQE